MSCDVQCLTKVVVGVGGIILTASSIPLGVRGPEGGRKYICLMVALFLAR